MAVNAGLVRRLVKTLGSVKTGIVLLIIVGVVSALGTIILQRPVTSPEDLELKYSPSMLRLLDAIGLTNVYHAWWFIVLLALVAVSIILASIDRWPNVWRFYARPYRKPDSHFRAAHPLRAQFAIHDTETGIAIAERAMRNAGLDPERVHQDNEVSLFAEKNRFAVLAVYIVHASLLLIFLGGILDGSLGFKGYVQLVPGTPATSQIELADKTAKSLPFSIRCDGAGQENYTGEFAGMPKRWWSTLTIINDGREVVKKDIAVNDPLVYHGVRFYQSGFGRADMPESVVIAYAEAITPDSSRTVTVRMNEQSEFAGNRVRVLRFLPDALRHDDGDVQQRSTHLETPAVQLEITNREGKTSTVWVLYQETVKAGATPFTLQLADLNLQNATGLQVSYEPGQWAVWAGCLLMALGLIVSFYVVHMRFWAVAVADGKGGLNLWIGAAANKRTRESFEEKFRCVIDEIATELKPQAATTNKVLAMAASAD